MLVQKGIPFTKKITYDYELLDGKSLSDIVEVLYTWQQLKEDVDTKFLLKRYSLNNISLDNENKEFTIQIKNTDFSKVIDNEIYYEILSIKYSGDVSFRDIVLKNPDGDTYSTIHIKPAWVQITE